jgi:hypothetical protein
LGLAQIELGNDPIPACTADEIQSIANITAEFQERFAEVIDKSPDDLSELRLPLLDEVGGDALYLQVIWWADGAPELPHCALGVNVHRIYGHLFDQLRVTTLSVEFGLTLFTRDDVDLPVAGNDADHLREIEIEYDAINDVIAESIPG